MTVRITFKLNSSKYFNNSKKSGTKNHINDTKTLENTYYNIKFAEYGHYDT